MDAAIEELLAEIEWERPQRERGRDLLARLDETLAQMSTADGASSVEYLRCEILERGDSRRVPERD